MTVAQFVKMYGYKTVSLALKDLANKAGVVGNDSRIIEVMSQHLEAALKDWATDDDVF